MGFAGVPVRPADPGHPRIGAEFQHGAGHGAFDDRGIVRIADKAVGDGGKHRIGGSSGRDTEVLATPSAVILNGAERTRLDDVDTIRKGLGLRERGFGFPQCFHFHETHLVARLQEGGLLAMGIEKRRIGAADHMPSALRGEGVDPGLATGDRHRACRNLARAGMAWLMELRG